MNVTVENLAACKKLVRFEVEAKAVEEAFDTMSRDYVKHARLPGFRPGKAPKEMVLRQFEKDIAEEVKKRLIGDAYRQGVKDQKLDVLGYPDIEEIHFERGQALQFAATVETTPQFTLPEYRGLRAERGPTAVTDEDVTRAIELLREQKSTFNKVDRPVQQGDYVVISYTGTCEGKPITELAPTAKGLTEHKNFWVEVKPDSFIPGFAMQLCGAKAGDSRQVTVDFPAEFVTPQLAGKKGEYAVEVVEVKEKVLPAMDEAFAKSFGAENLERLREGVRSDLQNELNLKNKRSIRNQLVKALLASVEFELPETTLQVETRNVVYEMVQENQGRGVPREVIEAQKDQLYNVAQGVARERVKMGFLFHQISEKEGIRAEEHEFGARVAVMAQANQMAPQKYLQEMQKQGRVTEIYQQIIHEKVLNLLHENAKIEEAPAAPKG